MKLNKQFWESRYKNKDTGWDIGQISTPIKEYVDQLSDKNISILIPGCGNGHEAEYLFFQGFKNVTILDIASEPLNNFKKRNPTFPKHQLVCQDFFDHENTYDLILEQTFFCAIDPTFREKYVNKMHFLLKKNGKLTGLLFAQKFGNNEPPYGGSINEYTNLFSKKFNIKIIEKANNSIKPRKGKELFFIFKK